MRSNVRRYLYLVLLLLPVLGQAQVRMPLHESLKTLNKKRGTYFLYDQRLLDGVAAAGKPNWKASTEAVLGTLLTGTNLTFRKVGDCYLIEQRTPPAAAVGQPTAASATAPSPVRRFTISGFVRETESRELVIGATVYVGHVATTTNHYGFYSLTLPESETADVVVSMVGYRRVHQQVGLRESITLDVDLDNHPMLDEVVLSGSAGERAFGEAQTGQTVLPTPLASNTPTLLGEKDILKTLQFVAGVQRGLDGQVGLHVRGGGADQNLLMLDEAPIYNANHLFGFFSAINVDALKSTRFEKGGFSARYGGRLSSVVDMNMREGSKQRWQGEVGTGLVASRLLLEGPIKTDKASFLLTARHTNFAPLLGNFVAKVVQDVSGTDWRANFYDLNAKVNADLGTRDKLYLSGYFGRNYFGGGDGLTDTQRWANMLTWQNQTGNLRWNHLFSEKLFTNTSLIVSNYDFNTQRDIISTEPATEGQLINHWRHYDGITDLTAKYDADFFPSASHHLQFGVVGTFRSYRLNGFDFRSLATLGDRAGLEHTRSLEASAYAEDRWDIGHHLKLNLGGRLTRYTVGNQTFWRTEPRLAAAVKLDDNRAVRLSYSEMNQFIHLLSNTGLGLPTDLWVPATDLVKPQHARQAVIGFVQDVGSRWQFTLEAYQKWMNHVISYRENANFVGVTNASEAGVMSWERNVTSGRGEATGVEATVQRKTGRLTGWVNYTWSMTHWQFPELNNGNAFSPRHDRRHSIAVLGTYALRPNLRLSMAWTYASGNPFSVPVSGVPGFGHLGLGSPNATPGQPTFGNESPLVQVRTAYSNFRAEPLHRLDFTAQFERKGRWLGHRIEVGVTNAYGRRNPFFYNLVNAGGELALRRVALFTFVPSLNYAIRF